MYMSHAVTKYPLPLFYFIKMDGVTLNWHLVV